MYKKMISVILLIGTIAFGMSANFAKEPKNLALAKAALIKYHDSGEYVKDQSKIIDKAMLYLKTRLEREARTHSNKKMAIVLDIDETALSNYSDRMVMDFGGTYEDIQKSQAKGTDPAIQPTLELYRYAKANHIAIFFVSSRAEEARAITSKNLETAGYKNYDGLILKPDNYPEKSISSYKISARQQIEKQGYDIILNIGDQESDLAGKHADKTFKLPNPYYFIP
jgi:predicted secreted acid phosphatase